MSKNKKVAKLFMTFILIGGFGLAAYFWIDNSVKIVAPKIAGQRPLNILVLGLDGEGDQFNRTDALLLVNIKPNIPRVTIFSIPRDFRVYIPGHGLDKINHSYLYGGPKLLKKVVSDFFGVPISYYIKLDFLGLTNIVERLGGVIIDVEKRMHYVDRSQNLCIDLYPGLQRLNGVQAIGYIRFRHDEKGDIGRIERQQKFLLALADELLKIGSLGKIPGLIEELRHNLETNINPFKLVYLGLTLKKAYDISEIHSFTLKGTPVVINGVFYFEPDLDDINEKIQKISEN